MTPQTKRLTPEELMQPRYEVIADYPGSFEAVGEVITITENILTVSAQQRLRYDKYPGIYRRLDWWEHRTPEEMPLFLKTNPDDKSWVTHGVHKVEQFYGDNQEYVSFADDNNEYQYCTEWYIPATLQDYTQYINSLK